MPTVRNHGTAIAAVIAAVIAATIGCLAADPVSYGAEFYVAPGGKDDHPGTREQPLATLETARDAARKAGAGPKRIVLMPGEYFLTQPLELDARDNGLTIEAEQRGQVTLYGGRLVTGWRRDGDKFWCADLPGVQEGTWDFRTLLVNGRLPPRARLPESGAFLNRGTWNLPLLPAVAGYWERKPTREELTTMPYDPRDLPETLDVKNAEVRLYHMWDESLVGVARNDKERQALIFSTPPIWPPGALGLKKYVIFNTREGLTQPGQWYLDRTAGRVVYWPLPGEDPAQCQVIAPTLERLIHIAGTAQQKAEQITLRGLTLQATTVPLKPASFGAGAFEGALTIAWAQQCVLEGIEICNVGGLGIVAQSVNACRIADCHVHHTGACGVRINGSDTRISGNHIHHVGVYYLDEGAHDCLVERNVSVGVARPTHNHIARNITLRDNVFIVDKDMALSFQSSAGCTFERNMLFAPGKITITQPNGIKLWKDNMVFRNGLGQDDVPQAFTIDDAIPPTATPGRKTWSAEVVRVETAPALDCEITPAEWPGKIQRLDRDPTRQPACGAPVLVKFSCDEQFLYVAATVTMFEPAKISQGSAWGQDDGVEICLAGKTPDGRPTTFAIRGYANGTVQSVAEAGAPAEAAERLGQGVRFAVGAIQGPVGTAKGWRGEWAIPFESLGLKPTPGLKTPFNMSAFCSEYSEWHCWEGTLAENWRLEQAGTLQFP